MVAVVVDVAVAVSLPVAVGGTTSVRPATTSVGDGTGTVGTGVAAGVPVVVGTAAEGCAGVAGGIWPNAVFAWGDSSGGKVYGEPA